MTNSVNERKIILDILIDVVEGGRFSHLVLRDVLDKYQFIDKKKRAFISRVTQGTLEHMIEIDYYINQVSKTKVKKMKPVMRNVLRMTVYQMKYMDSVPDSAAIDEAVKLIKKRGLAGLSGFANGVLRNLSRTMETIELPKESEGAIYFSVKYSVPLWIIEEWMKSYSSDIIEKMCQGFLKEEGTFIRINLNKIDKSSLMELLKEEGVTVKEHPYLNYALEIRGYDSLQFLDSFNNGLYQVQDVSSMLVAEVATPKSGDYIIDVCAAPGGKSIHLADKLAGTGHVEARDLTPYKVEFLTENIERNGVTNMSAKVWDATVLDKEAISKADIVIADLPCSGLGIMGKKPDIRYRIKPQDLQELAQLQREILEKIVEYVKPGGKLIYSTCTINTLENEENANYINSELGLKSIDIRSNVPEELRGEVTSIETVVSEGLLNESVSNDTDAKDMQHTNQLQLLPGVHHCDGFFIAAFVK